MEAKVIKFRCWDKYAKIMRDDGSHPNGVPHMKYDVGIMSSDAKNEWATGIDGLEIRVDSQSFILMQFTGKKCFNDHEVYEDDILFYEEETENGDRRYYLVVTWIKEWSMFATLHVSEYKKYLTEGAEALDESMFWTYTLEGCGDYHYSGNIWENPYLIRYPDDQNNLTGGQPTTEQEVP